MIRQVNTKAQKRTATNGTLNQIFTN